MEKIYYNIEKFEIINSQEEIIKNLEEADIIYDKLEFHELHKKKEKKVYEINFIKNTNQIARVYLGIKENKGYISYSSPFANITIKSEYKMEDFYNIIESLKKIKDIFLLESLRIVLPPKIYDEFIDEKISMLIKKKFIVKYIDINNYLELNKSIKIGKSILRDYRIAEKNGLLFRVATIEEAYEIIKKNREERGYPLKMSLEHILTIEKLIPKTIEAFIVENKEKRIAAALVFNVKPKIKQVVYWGNIEEAKKEKPMAFLSKSLVEFYQKTDEFILDIGTSSEEGILSDGLYNFKKSIGCKSCLKFSLEYKND